MKRMAQLMEHWMVHLVADQKENRMVCLKAPNLERVMVQQMEHPAEHHNDPRLARMMVQLMEHPKEHQKESWKVHLMELRSVILLEW